MSHNKRQKITTTATTITQVQAQPKLTLRSSTAEVSLDSNLEHTPSRYKGTFDHYDTFEISPYIGTEFRKGTIQVRDLLYADNSDELIKDLAVMISERGVVLFRDQKLSPEEHTLLIKKIDTLPRGLQADDALLHIHPMTSSNPEYGDHFVKIHSKLNKVYKGDPRSITQRTTGLFHTDLFYEKKPASYSALHMTVVPENGAGGTVFGSGYHALDRLTPRLAKFLEDLTVHADWNGNLRLYDKVSGDHYRESRGSKENQGASVTADHPLVRTNPITGWKSLYYSVIHGRFINELDYDESLMLTEFLERQITENHEYLIKLRWENNDLAIWDNRSTFHSATMDYKGLEVYREGFRVTTLGEIPYLDPASTTLKEWEIAKKAELESIGE